LKIYIFKIREFDLMLGKNNSMEAFAKNKRYPITLDTLLSRNDFPSTFNVGFASTLSCATLILIL